MKPWAEKANRIISKLCLQAYREANPIKRKKHRPYVVPSLAQELVECLDTDDELRAKRLFLSYEGIKAVS